MTWEPVANYTYLNLRCDGFDEVGGEAALTVKATSQNLSFATFGLRVNRDITLKRVTAKAMFSQ